MNPRPFYRSRLFWLGLPGLVFLLLGWWLSMGHWSVAGFWGGRVWGIGQLGGEVYVWWDADRGPEWMYFVSEHSEMTGEQLREVKDWYVAESEWNPSYRIVFIPYYWPVLAYTATWLLTLALWQRRKSRILKLHTEP